jgi:hypothetical protein
MDRHLVQDNVRAISDLHLDQQFNGHSYVHRKCGHEYAELALMTTAPDADSL